MLAIIPEVDYSISHVQDISDVETKTTSKNTTSSIVYIYLVEFPFRMFIFLFKDICLVGSLFFSFPLLSIISGSSSKPITNYFLSSLWRRCATGTSWFLAMSIMDRFKFPFFTLFHNHLFFKLQTKKAKNKNKNKCMSSHFPFTSSHVTTFYFMK